jgi:aryl-alcohol dehydrogenase-like predicted oxidoreductase
LAFGFLKKFPEIDSVIIGVNSASHLRENAMAFEEACKVTRNSYSQWRLEDTRWITPSLWPANLAPASGGTR